MPAKFITLEGGEGTGKSTQADLLADRLRNVSEDFEVIVTREPGGSERAERIRTLLLDSQLPPPTPLTETLLFYAARDDHLHHIINPALDAGKWVICDRFSDSTRAYQGAAGGLTGQIIDRLDKWVVSDHQPGLTIILDLPASLGLERAASRRTERSDDFTDRFEGLNLKFHQNLRHAFVQIAASYPSRCVLVDAAGEISVVASRIWDIVADRWSLPVS